MMVTGFSFYGFGGIFYFFLKKYCGTASILFLFLLSNGCSLSKQQIDTSGGNDRALFTPASHVGAQKISEAEALELTAKLSPRMQGMGSWNDIGFAVDQSLAHASNKPVGTLAYTGDGLRVTYGQLADSLRHFKKILPRLDGNERLLASEFIWHRIGPDFGVTGYYEPTLSASRTKNASYPYPLYRLPRDVKKGVPYHTRHAIDRKGVLAGKGLEIAWVSSETDAFFLHIQGSGRLRFSDGSVTHVLYAGKNNRAYKALGRVMRDEGLLEPDAITMKSIRETLKKYPHRKAELFDKNPSYIFFSEAVKGPLGAMGRPLTPYVSLAVDRTVIPHGTLNFFITPLPGAEGTMNRPFYGLMLPQDTGGAIKKNRVDLFCGPGDEAAHIAGYLNARGAMYLLIKK